MVIILSWCSTLAHSSQWPLGPAVQPSCILWEDDGHCKPRGFHISIILWEPLCLSSFSWLCKREKRGLVPWADIRASWSAPQSTAKAQTDLNLGWNSCSEQSPIGRVLHLGPRGRIYFPSCGAELSCGLTIPKMEVRGTNLGLIPWGNWSFSWLPWRQLVLIKGCTEAGRGSLCL